MLLFFFFTLILAHGGHKHIHTDQSSALVDLYQLYLPNKTMQALFSVLLVSLPSIPVFLILQKMTNKTNFQAVYLDRLSFFACGSMLGDAYLHMMPALDQNNSIYVLFGIIIFYIVDFLLIKLKGSRAISFLISDLIHNLTDGISLGATFNISTALGLTSTFAILLHELPHEFGDYAYLLKLNHRMFYILKTQLITATGAFIGALIGIYFGNIYEQQLLGFAIGGFLYTAIGIIMVDIKKSYNIATKYSEFFYQIIWFVFGVFCMDIVANLE